MGGSRSSWRPRPRAADLAFVALALGLALGLKSFYSRAGFDDLVWILAPTRRLVEWLTGAAFVAEPGEGFLSRDRLYEIAPACAGVNFMIAAFASLVCGLVRTRSTLRGRLGLLLAAAVASYAATVLANASRIAIALGLRESGASLGPLTPGRVHLVSGITVYLVFLYALHALATRVAGTAREHPL